MQCGDQPIVEVVQVMKIEKTRAYGRNRKPLFAFGSDFS